MNDLVRPVKTPIIIADSTFDNICDDCRRTNYRNACTGSGHHCPLAIIDEMLEHRARRGAAYD